MLVFTRKAGESLIIGDRVEVKVLSLDRDQVRIGISAPREIAVHRHEVFEEISRQNQAAVRAPIPSGDLLSRLKKTRR